MSSTDLPGSDLTRKQRREAARAERKALEEAEAAKAARRRRATQLGGVIVAALVVVGVLIALSSSGGTKKAVTASKAASTLFAGIPQSGVTLGSPTAPVTIEEFADLQCPYCQEYTLDSLPTLVSTYVKTGKVKMIFRNLHFIGPDSYTAAQFAGAAGQQNHLWDFIDTFYANQQQENTGYITDSFLRSVAAKVPGLNVSAAETARYSPTVAQQITTADQLAQSGGIDSTPSFLIGKSGGTLKLFSPQDLTTASSFTGEINGLLGTK